MMVLDKLPEEDSAMVEYYFGCDYKVTENEIYTVDPEDCCLALALPSESAVVSPQPGAPQPALALPIGPLAILGGVIAAGAAAIISNNDGGGGGGTPSAPPPTPPGPAAADQPLEAV